MRINIPELLTAERSLGVFFLVTVMMGGPLANRDFCVVEAVVNALLLDVTVPDDLLRVRLRRRLAWAGFGSLPSGLAITPHADREPEALRILESLGLETHAVSLIARLGTIGHAKRVIAEAWDLDELALRYKEFVAEVAKQRPTTEEETFVAHTRLVHEWRRFPFFDPGLPIELLPRHWIGLEAKKVFDRHYAKWKPAATRWFAAVNTDAG